MDKPLYWDDSYEIVQVLMAVYPNEDIQNIGLQALYQMIVKLPNFADDPTMVNDAILSDILREWYEESDTEWNS